MRALIFAAGKGERMRPLTERIPKPLLVVAGKPLIEWHLEKLAALGVSDVVINTSWLADSFQPVLGDGARWKLRLHYSYEGSEPLETGGGMLQACRVLGDRPFLAVSGDIWTDFDFARLPAQPSALAHLVMVANPPHHPHGDFSLDEASLLQLHGERLTYSGVGVYRPEILQDWRTTLGQTPGALLDPPRFKLAPLLHAAIARGQASGQYHDGLWTDVGTPERLAQLDHSLRS